MSQLRQCNIKRHYKLKVQLGIHFKNRSTSLTPIYYFNLPEKSNLRLVYAQQKNKPWWQTLNEHDSQALINTSEGLCLPSGPFEGASIGGELSLSMLNFTFKFKSIWKTARIEKDDFCLQQKITKKWQNCRGQRNSQLEPFV